MKLQVQQQHNCCLITEIWTYRRYNKKYKYAFYLVIVKIENVYLEMNSEFFKEVKMWDAVIMINFSRYNMIRFSFLFSGSFWFVDLFYKNTETREFCFVAEVLI